MDFSKITGIVKTVGKNTVGLYVVDLIGANNLVRNDSNVIIKALKIGGVFYLVRIGIESVDIGGMPNISIARIVDDVLYYALSFMICDKLGFINFVDYNTPNLVSGKLEDILKSAIVWTTIDEAGHWMENSGIDVIRHLSGKLGIQ